jgi:DNA polymerase-3 subunit alpha
VAATEVLLRHASRAAEDRETKQESLFGAIDPAFAPRPSLPIVEDWPAVEKLQQEFAAIGFYLSSHPLDAYGKSLERAGILRCADLPAALAANTTPRVRLAGIVLSRKERTSARGNRFAFVQMSDPSGVYEVTLFAEMLREARALFESGQPVVVTVDVRSEEDNLRLTAQKIEPLDDVVAHAAAGLRVFLGGERALSHLKNLFTRDTGGRGRVTVVLDLDDGEVEIAIPGGFRVDPKMRAAVKSLPGIVDVHDI